MDNSVEATRENSKKTPGNNEVEKAKSQIIVEIIEYIPNPGITKINIKKSSGNISVMSFDAFEGLIEMMSPFDTYVQIIEAKAEIVIDKKPALLADRVSSYLRIHQII